MLTVKKIKSVKHSDIKTISAQMAGEQKYDIANFVYNERCDKNYRPKVQFAIAHDNAHIVIRYDVTESYILARARKNNDSVCQDSCVEFFVKPPNQDNYYNFEFSCIGVCLLGCQPARNKGGVLQDACIDAIRRYSSLGAEPFEEKSGDFQWHLTVSIPVVSFQGLHIGPLSGQRFTANFYKCGDKTRKPHWIAWSKVGALDFHRPQDFAEIYFE